MKLFLVILAAYIQLLAITPCDGYGIGFIKLAEEYFGLEHIHDHNHSDEPFKGCEDDGCTPFCTCHCCSVPASEPTGFVLEIEFKAPPPAIEPAYIPDINPFNFSAFVWHPPISQ